LLVVNNNSDDETCEVTRMFAATASVPVRYVFEQRQGRSSALNAGIAAANGEIIALTDDDVLLHPGWLGSVKRTFAEFDCSAVAGRVVPVWNHSKPDWLEMGEQQAVVNFELGDDCKQIQCPPLGANAAFRRNVFAKYGLFRLDLGVSGSDHGITCEDTEFGFRLVQGGEKIMYCPSAIVYHPVDPRRTTKDYFLKWYYNDGRSIVRAAGVSNDVICYFGIPRWMLRGVFTHFAKWCLSLNRKRRFHHKLRTYRNIGNIVEAYRLSHMRAPATSCPELRNR